MIIYWGEKSIELEKFTFALAEEIECVSSQSEVFEKISKSDGVGIVVLGSNTSMQEAIQFAEKTRIEYPEIKVVLIRTRVDVDTLTKALRSGISEVVSSEDTSAFVQSVRHLRGLLDLRKTRLRDNGSGGPKGKVIVVFSAKGGCGKTTTAVNIAAGLSSNLEKRVCLVDLDLQFGDVAVSLQANPEKTMSAAIGMGANLDLFGTRSILTKFDSKLDLLLAPTNPTDVEYISGETIEKVLTHLILDYEYVVVDTPPAFTDFVLKSMEMMNLCLLITTLEMPAIKNLKIVLETLNALKIDSGILQVLINRADLKTGVSPEEAEMLLGVKIDYLLPNEAGVPVATNQGVPLVTYAPKSGLAKQFLKISSDIEKRFAPPPQSDPKRKLFSRGKSK